MKKLLLLSAFAAAVSTANAQTTLFEDNFESYPNFIISNIGQYTLFDVDGSATYIGGVSTTPGVNPWNNAYAPMVCQVFNPSAAGVQNGHDDENSNFDPHSGNKYLGFWAATTTANNDWLVLPKLTLGTGNKFTFWVKSLADDYGLEQYTVAVVDGATGAPQNVTRFEQIGGVRTAPLTWTQVSVDIPTSYDGKDAYLAIRYVGSDVYMLMVDDIKVTTAALGVSNSSKQNTNVFPNPSKGVFNFTSNKKTASVEVYSADGRMIKKDNSVQTVDISNQPKGVYILKIHYADGTTDNKQLIKQ